MRINKFVASSSDLSRRGADTAIAEGRILVNGQIPEAGRDTTEADTVTLDGRVITPAPAVITIMLNKPEGYVVSRDGQGSKTIYDLLPENYQRLNPIGRLDKESSGLLLLTNDGNLVHELTHPSKQKIKLYEVRLNKPLQPLHRQMVSDHGLQLDDGLSRLELERLHDGDDTAWIVAMHEGRNRQIRRTFAALGYTVQTLHRTHFGPYSLGNLNNGAYKQIQHLEQMR
jgi:23S rRNA pseudouridine2605 synthase